MKMMTRVVMLMVGDDGNLAKMMRRVVMLIHDNGGDDGDFDGGRRWREIRGANTCAQLRAGSKENKISFNNAYR